MRKFSKSAKRYTPKKIRHKGRFPRKAFKGFKPFRPAPTSEAYDTIGTPVHAGCKED